MYCGIVLFTLNEMVYDIKSDFAKEHSTLLANQVVKQSESFFNGISNILSLASKNTSRIIVDPVDPTRNVQGILQHLIEFHPNIYCSWLVLEPGNINGDAYYSRAFLRLNKGISEIPGPPEELLKDANRSRWYNIPIKTGKPAFLPDEVFDYHVGEGEQYTGSIAFPVYRNYKIVGVIGIDITYESTFKFIDELETQSTQRVLLLAQSGRILYASNMGLRRQMLPDLGFSPEAVERITDAMHDKRTLMFEDVSPLRGTASLFNLVPLDIPGSEIPVFLLTDIARSTLFYQPDSTVIVISVLGLVLMATSVFLATRNIVKPILRLTRNAEWIAKGQTAMVLDKYRPPLVPRHEVDILEASLIKMVEEIVQNHELRVRAMTAEGENQQMLEAAKAKDRFFANVSHEIRTPMNAILGMSELLSNASLAPQEARYVKGIKVAAESLLGLINDILDLSKLESGNLELNEVHYDLWDLLDNIYALSHFLASNKQLVFEYELHGDIPQYVYGDDVRVRQILMNLLGNAIKFTRERRVKLEVFREDEALRFNISDTGCGIRDEDMKLLFEPFKQLEPGKNRKIQGTGLGLSICLNLVQLMRGTISVDSVYGLGSTFSFIIPIVQGDPELSKTPANAKNITFSKDTNVLVVDDSRLNLDVASGLLNLYGINCDIAISGADALAMVRQRHYDVVFMDHMMPEMDGVETTKAIREMDGEFSDLVIVALTANAVVGTKELFLEAGMNDFMSKPIDKTTLQNMLNKWVPKEKRITPDGKITFASPSTQDTNVTDNNVAEKPTPDPNDRIIEELRKIRHLDVNQGLQYSAGQTENYLRILRMFHEMADELKDALPLLLEKGDIGAFRIEIHGFKSALANIGATELSERALNLELAVDKDGGATCHDLLPLFLEDLRHLDVALDAALSIAT